MNEKITPYQQLVLLLLWAIFRKSCGRNLADWFENQLADVTNECARSGVVTAHHVTRAGNQPERK